MGLLDSLIVSLGFKVNADQLHRANELLEGVNHRLELIAGLEIAKSLFETVERFSSLGDALEQAAFQAGVSTEEFQKLTYAGSQFNASQEQIQGGLARMTRLLQQARDGSKGAIAQFAKLGIDQEQIAGFKNAEDAFFGVQDALAGIPDQFRRVAATQAIFGRGAVGMVKFASAGSSATKALGREAANMGAVISDEGVEGLAKFEESMKAVGLTIRGFFGTIAGAFAPAISSAVKDVQKLIASNRELLAQNVSVWSERIAFGLGAAIELFRIAASAVQEFIEKHPKLIAFVTKTASVLIGMSLAVGTLKLAFGGIIAVIRIVGAAIALMGGTVTLTLASVSLLALGLKALWDVAHGADFKDTAFGKSLVWLKDFASEAAGAFKESMGGFDSPESLALPPHANVPTREANRRKKQVVSIDSAMQTLSMAQSGVAQMSASAVSREAPGQSTTAMSSRNTHNVSVNNAITMQFHGPTDSKEVRSQMKKIADEVFTQVAQTTYRDHLPAAAR